VGVHPTGAASWKTHGLAGSFPIDLPFTGPVGIECRTGGGNNDYQMILTFAQPITFSSAAVTKGGGNVSSSSISGDGLQLTANLTGVTNAQIITLALFDVSDGTYGGDVGVRMGLLLDDSNGDGGVNSADVSQTKSQSGQPVGSSNFREDVNVDGFLSSADISLVKSKSGTALP
jgi:hypothetical protein